MLSRDSKKTNQTLDIGFFLGWIASAGDRPVFYKVPFFTTVQDYMIMEAIKIWVYDRPLKKRRQVTLRVATSKRNRAKTLTASTFANFIHKLSKLSMVVLFLLLVQ